MQRITTTLSVIFIMAAGLLTKEIITDSFANQSKKNDYAELNNIKYGLFSTDVWKRQITAILAAEIGEFDLTKANQRQVRIHIQSVLDKMIDKVSERMKKENKASASGWFRQAFTDMFVSIDDIKKGIPEYSNAVMKEINKPKNKAQLKSYLNERISNYATETSDLQDRSELTRILKETFSNDIATARERIDQDISATSQRLVIDASLLIILAVVLFALNALGHRALGSHRLLLILVPMVFLLLVGVTTPMIDMEAKISKLSFTLIGHPVIFENQILYFQSKSILNVFWLMMTHPDLEMKLVGVLLVSFSVAFPLLKTLALLAYHYDFGLGKANRLVQYFVFKSGKWSMTDVMVVAIFMAYIGFNGIIDSQLGNLGDLKPEVDVVTTNGTALQPGYYLFLAYVLLAMALSGVLAKRRTAGIQR